MIYRLQIATGSGLPVETVYVEAGTIMGAERWLRSSRSDVGAFIGGRIYDEEFDGPLDRLDVLRMNQTSKKPTRPPKDNPYEGLDGYHNQIGGASCPNCHDQGCWQCLSPEQLRD